MSRLRLVALRALRAASMGCKSPSISDRCTTTTLDRGSIFAASLLALAIKSKIKTGSYASNGDAEMHLGATEWSPLGLSVHLVVVL